MPESNGLKKSIRGILMAGAMILLASLVHMLIHYSEGMDQSSKVIVGQTVVAVAGLLTMGFSFYFGKSQSDEDG